MLTKPIYYANKELLDQIHLDFDYIEKKSWFHLYQHRSDKTYWRLDERDKYQEPCFVRLMSREHWEYFDDKDLRIELLQETRGISDEACVWNQCDSMALQGLAYCARHAYEEFGVRR